MLRHHYVRARLNMQLLRITYLLIFPVGNDLPFSSAGHVFERRLLSVAFHRYLPQRWLLVLLISTVFLLR